MRRTPRSGEAAARVAFLALLVAFAGQLGSGRAALNEVTTAATASPHVLVFSATAGYRHGSIPDGIAAIEALGDEHGFAVTTSEDATVFTDAGLSPFDAVIFLSTTGDILDETQQAAFERYIRAGGGFVGVHAASDTEYDWPWYGRLVGAWFARHPSVQPAVIDVVERDHPSTRHLPARWERRDEWYDFRRDPSEDVSVLLRLDESSYTGGGMGASHPIAWFHEFEGGRAWYTGMGHTSATYREPDFLAHLLGGMLWAARIVNPPVQATPSPAVPTPVPSRTLIATPTAMPPARPDPTATPLPDPRATERAATAQALTRTPAPTHPPIEGFGAITRGADSCPAAMGGPSEYVVTSLADDGSPGTLRDALHVGSWDPSAIAAKSCRRVRFAVAGEIVLGADLRLRSSYLTLDGCSAPAPGITITQPDGTYPGVLIEGTRAQARDILIRCLRFKGAHDRPGQGAHRVGDAILSVDADCADVPADRRCAGGWEESATDGGVRNLVLDHIVLATARDKLTLWGKVENVTISNSFFYRSPLALLMSYYNGPYDLERRNISLHHNLFAQNNERNPQLRGWIRNLDVRNNIVFGYDHFNDDAVDEGSGPGDGYGIRIKNEAGEESVHANLVNNVFAVRPEVAARALIYGPAPGRDADDGGPEDCLEQGDVYAEGRMGSLWVAGNDLPDAACDVYSTVDAPLDVAPVTTHEAGELCRVLTATVGLARRSPVEVEILEGVRVALGCEGSEEPTPQLTVEPGATPKPSPTPTRDRASATTTAIDPGDEKAIYVPRAIYSQP